jgi:hypothetical protein
LKRSRWILLAAMVVAGCVVLPVVAYVVGGRLVGPYAGPRGLASYLGAIYSDAGQGNPLAVAMLGGPLLCAGAWLIRSWLLKRLRRPQAAD